MPKSGRRSRPPVRGFSVKKFGSILTIQQAYLVIRWETREHWKSISSERLQQVEEQFDQAMGDSYPIIDSAEYQVRIVSPSLNWI
jgi:hypothetical protein